MNTRMIIKRLVQLVIIVAGVSVVVFFMLRLIPGDPARLLLGEYASPDALEALRVQLGLHQSLPVQYWIFVKHMLTGNFGNSYRTGAPVLAEISARFGATVELAVAAMIIATVIGILAGVLSSVFKNSLIDYASMLGALIGVSTPVFWLGLMLIYFFSVKLGILPMMGRIVLGVELHTHSGLLLVDSLIAGNLAAFRDALKHLLLPAFCLSTIPMAIIARITRSSMLEVLHQDYIRTARAKGMGRAVVILRHALGNALLPIITVMGINMGILLSGAVLTETVFSWPGLGRYLVDSLMGRDYNAVQACILIFAVMMALINLAVDLIYALIDPRIRNNG